MREIAIVVENKNNRAQVEIRKSAACDGCKGCSVGREGKALRVWAQNPIGARVGQTVEIELSAATFLSATLIAYGVPLIAFLLGIGFGSKVANLFNLSSAEVVSFFIGLAFMSISFFIIHFFTSREEVSKKYSSRIVRII